MKTLFRSTLLLASWAILIGQGWSQTTYNSQVIVSGPGSAQYTYTGGLTGNQSGVGAYAAGANGTDSENYGTWTAMLYWQDASSPTNTFSNEFNPNGNTTVTTNWSISTPIPEISPFTGDAQVNGSSGIARTIAGITSPFLHVYLNDDYKVANVTSNAYTGADRYGSTSVTVYDKDIVGNTILTSNTETAGAASYTSAGSSVGAASYSGGTSTSVYDVASQFSTALTQGEQIQFTVNPGTTSYPFGKSNANADAAGGSVASFPQGSLGPQTTIYVHPRATITGVSWAGPGTSTNNPSPITFTNFPWNVYTATINATNLYPANFTWVEIQFTPQGGSSPTASYYLYETTHAAVNSDTDTGGNHTQGTISSQTTSITQSAPTVSPNMVSSSASDPQNITFVIRLADLQTISAQAGGTYTFLVHTYTPLGITGSGSTWTALNPTNPGWGTQDFSLTASTYYYTPTENINSGVVTAPQ